MDHAFEKIAVEATGQIRGETRINAILLDVVMLFWLYQCSHGNKSALNLLAALAIESLERLFDKAFGVSRSEAEYNDRLAQRIRQLEADLEQLGESYAEPDLLREHINR
ncbi:hypothetical protein [Almyronema epifaneia]|uniref:Uncharacterized protein n=1 Tax=Almyronema epifaneia S1 TaxID=2991925 RepID=A0ABW6IJW3_9CYAN